MNADVDLQGSETNQWTPIGTDADKYAGTFNGNGHKIEDLYWNGWNAQNIGFLRWWRESRNSGHTLSGKNPIGCFSRLSVLEDLSDFDCFKGGN